MSGFEVQASQCATCIYRPDSPLDLQQLEAAIKDGYGGFSGYRICHHSDEGSGIATKTNFSSGRWRSG